MYFYIIYLFVNIDINPFIKEILIDYSTFTVYIFTPVTIKGVL